MIPVGLLRVAGVLKHARVDRPPMTAAMAREMAERFVAGTVPILAEHDGNLLGYLDNLAVEHDRDLRFRGEMIDLPWITDRLSKGTAVSMETIERGANIPGEGPGRTLWKAGEMPYWRGKLDDGWNLTGVALCDTPAAPGSAIWAESAAPQPRAAHPKASSPPVRWGDGYRLTAADLDEIDRETAGGKTVNPFYASVYLDRDTKTRWTDLGWAQARSTVRQRNPPASTRWTDLGWMEAHPRERTP